MTDQQPDRERELSDVRIALNHLRVVAYATLRAGATREQVDTAVAEAVRLFDNGGPRW